MVFEWDVNKAAVNLVKHGVSFDEAKTVFDDPLYVDSLRVHTPQLAAYHLAFDTPQLAAGSFIGMSQRGRLLLIAYAERGDITRLISAREATRMERKAYEQG